MDDLAEELGMSKKTLYAHFASKKELVEAVILHKLSEVETQLEEITARESADFPATLRALLACMQAQVAEISPLFVRDIRRDAPELFTLIENRRPAIIHKHFGRVLTRGRRAGLIRRDIPVRLITEMLTGAVQSIMNPQKMAQLRITPQMGYSAIVSAVLQGVITQEGRKRS